MANATANELFSGHSFKNGNLLKSTVKKFTFLQDFIEKLINK